MQIFLAGSVSGADEKQLEKYGIYEKVLKPFGKVIAPKDIDKFIEKCKKEKTTFSQKQLDKIIVEYDLTQVKTSELVVCDLTLNSTGVGIELGVAKTNNIPVIFCYQKGTNISTIVRGAFFDSTFIEYKNIEQLQEKLIEKINKYFINK